MNKSALAKFIESEGGLSPEQIADLKAKYATPKRPRVSINTDKCPACGEKPERFDYACGACGFVKVRSQRRFWQFVSEREDGGTGRPKARKPKPQNLPPTPKEDDRPRFLPAVPDDDEEPWEPERREFLVVVGLVSIVAVAKYQYEAVNTALAALRLEKETGHHTLDMGATDAPVSHFTDYWTEDEIRAWQEAMRNRFEERSDG